MPSHAGALRPADQARLRTGVSPASPPAPRHLWTKLFYGSGSLAFGVKDNGFSVLLLLYYNQVLGLPAGLAGTAVALALVVDSVLDPITGYLSDNLRSRWGRRHPFMYAAAIPASLSYLLLWNPPAGLGRTALTAYLFFVAVLVRSFITLYEIPSAALGPELSEDYDERTSYMSFRFLFGWVGGVTIYILAFAVFLVPDAIHRVGQLNPAGYHNYAIAASSIMFASIMVSSVGTHSAIPRLRMPPPRKRVSAWTALREIASALGNPSSVALLAAGISGGLAAGLAFALTPYLYTFFWQLTAQQIAFLGFGSYVSAGGALVLAPLVSKRMGKKRGAIAVALCYACLAPASYLLRVAGLFPSNTSPALVPLLLAINIVVVGLSIIPPILVGSMISDVVEDNQVKTGRRTEGVLFAANAFLLKCVSGLGVAGSAVVLGLVHFPQNAAPGHVPPGTLVHFALLYVGAVTVMNLVSISFIGRYRISRETHQANLRTLAAQAAQAAEAEPRLTMPGPV